MIKYKDLQEKGICWTGYKRKKGTKPYEDGSCMKEEAEKHHVLAFGRMNPITSGHEAVVNKLHSVAKEHGASHSLVVSHSQDAKKNPLTGEQKVAHAKNAFPGTKVSAASKESPTILHHAAAAHAAGATHLHVVAGSDRHEEMHNLLHKYNGKDSGHGHYNFKKITVHSSGERDPDAEGTTGMSASKMREHAASGNKAEFHKGAPSKMKPEHKDAMYNDVRKGMNIKEETMDQQSDRKKQLKRFNDQMTKLNGPNKDTTLALDKKEKEEMHCVDETLRPEMGAETYINDFISSTNPKFNNKTKEERRKMAIGAYMAAKARGVNEAKDKREYGYEGDMALNQLATLTRCAEMIKDTLKPDTDLPEWVQSKITLATDYIQTAADYLYSESEIKEGRGLANKYYSMAQDRKETADENKGNHEIYHTHMADHHDHMSRYHEELGQHSHAQAHADKADIHHEKSMERPKAVKEETLDERNKQNALMRKTMDASRGAKFKLKNPVPDADPKHKTARDHNVAIGRALRNEATTGNPGYGYHGQHQSTHDADAAYKTIHAHVKSLTDSDDKTVKHYLDSAHGRHLVGHENDHEHIKKDFKKFAKYYKPEMHEGVIQDNGTDKIEPATSVPKKDADKPETKGKVVKSFKFFHGQPESQVTAVVREAAQKGVNVDNVNTAGQEPHEEKWEPVKKNTTKLKKVKEGTMKSYKEFLQSLDEKLVGNQGKLDKNKNGKVDKNDFELLRKEEADSLLEYESDESGVYRHTKKATYGTSYQDPEGADETAADMKKKEKKAAGRKAGQSTGSYKPRATMSKLKQAGATYK